MPEQPVPDQAPPVSERRSEPEATVAIDRDFVPLRVDEWSIELRVPAGASYEPDPDDAWSLVITTPESCGESIFVTRSRSGDMEAAYRGSKSDPGPPTKSFQVHLDERTDTGFAVKASFETPEGVTLWVADTGRQIGDFDYFCGGNTTYGQASHGMPAKAVDCVFAACQSLGPVSAP